MFNWKKKKSERSEKLVISDANMGIVSGLHSQEMYPLVVAVPPTTTPNKDTCLDHTLYC